MRQAGVMVSTSESIIFELLGGLASTDNGLTYRSRLEGFRTGRRADSLAGDAENPNFKPVSNLIKAEKNTTAMALGTLLDSADKPNS